MVEIVSLELEFLWKEISLVLPPLCDYLLTSLDVGWGGLLMFPWTLVLLMQIGCVFRPCYSSI